MPYDAVIDGATYVAGKVGSYALRFDGVDDQVVVNQVPSSLFTKGFTIAAWIRAFSVGEGNGMIVCKAIDGTGTDGFYLRIGGSPFANTNLGCQVASGAVRFSATSSIGDNMEWKHAMVTCDGASRLNFYVDGAQSGTANQVSGLVANITTSSSFVIGNLNGTRTWDGDIDDVRIYDRALSATEAKNLANGIPVTYGLIANYNFEEGSGSIVLDSNPPRFKSQWRRRR